MKEVGIEGGIEITTLSDIPSDGSGLGSSSAITVGLLHALYNYKKLGLVIYIFGELLDVRR